jgi:pilus assembly protein CpaE
MPAGASAAAVEVVERQLRPAIPSLKRIAAVEDIGKPTFNGGARPFVILAMDAEKHEIAGLVDDLIGRNKSVFFLVISDDVSAKDYKRLVQHGNADWAAGTGLPGEALDILRRVSSSSGPPSARPIVVSFVPSAGGVGNSTLAIETAIQLIKRRGKDSQIALVDLDFQTSHVCDYLDIAPKVQVEDIIESPERLDDQLLDVFASRHSSGLVVFAAPRSPLHVRGLHVEALSALFDRMARRYSHILVDLPVSAYEWTAPLLSASQGIVVTGVNTIPGLSQIADTLAAIRAETYPAAIRVVINRCASGLLGRIRRMDHVEKVLNGEERIYVRAASTAIDCINAGFVMGLSYPFEKAVKDISTIADFCSNLKADQARD